MKQLLDKTLWWLTPTRREPTLFGGEIRYKNWKGKKKVVSFKGGDPADLGLKGVPIVFHSTTPQSAPEIITEDGVSYLYFKPTEKKEYETKTTIK